MRHTPIVHRVHKHSRSGTIVKSYVRGSGKMKSNILLKKKHPIQYIVTIEYDNRSSKNLLVNTLSPYDALDQGLNQAPDGVPRAVILKRLTSGEVS